MEPCSAVWSPRAEYESQQGTCRWCKALLSPALKTAGFCICQHYGGLKEALEMWHRDVLINSLFVDYSQISNSQPLAAVVNMGAELSLGSKTEGKDVSRSGMRDRECARMIDQ